MAAFRAAYRRLLSGGELERRARQAYERMASCTLCPRLCHVNRLEGGKGACNTGAQALVSSSGPHFGEEPPLVGMHGSGTIFFTWCNMRCVFCQNCSISARGAGQPVTDEILAAEMLQLQQMGCHNINFVSPSHVVAPMLAALVIAAESGLRVPLVYNTGGYDSVETLRLLDGVVDIYMPDMKYTDADTAARYSDAPDYPSVNQAAVKEMHRQVGGLRTDQDGVAQRGLLVRHLVLPGDLAGTAAVAAFLAEEVSRDTCINVMDQYRPCHQAPGLPPLNRRVTPAEFSAALQAARGAGLHRFA